MLPWLLCGAIFLLLLIVCLRLWSLRRALGELAGQLSYVLSEDTNVRLGLSTRDRYARKLAAELGRELAELRRLRWKYQNGDRELKEAVTNISHDLRTPLTSILGYLQLLEGDSLTVEERREYLGIVRGRAKALQSLITSFYDLSRLEGGEYPLSREKVDLYHVLSELVAEFYNDFEQSGFDMTVELAPGLPAVTADPAGVLRVFTNLIRNALEHGQKRMSILLYRQEETVVSAFSNDAAGLTREDVEHVFDRFFTADKMRTGQSTGLGLAIVKALVGQMGHRVTAALDGEMFTVQVRWRI